MSLDFENKITRRMNDLEDRMTTLERVVAEMHPAPPFNPLPPSFPPEPPIIFPPTEKLPPDYIIDLSTSRHLDIPVDAGDTVTVGFWFLGVDADGNSGESYAGMTAVVHNGDGPYFLMSIPDYGHEQKKPGYQSSIAVGSTPKWGAWVVPQKELIYLHIQNLGDPGTIRLRWNREHVY